MYKKHRLSPHSDPNFRAKKAEYMRARREKEREAAEEVSEQEASQKRLFAEMRLFGFAWFGEIAPCQNAINIDEEIFAARAFAKALGMRDILPGDNKRNYILFVMREWTAQDCPLLNVASGTLSRRKVDPISEDTYIWFDGADENYEEGPDEVSTNAETFQGE